MESSFFLFDIAMILLFTKLFSILTKKVDMPQVVGALLAGIILGPAVLGVLHETEFLMQISELGVIVLMFCAGVQTDIGELKRSGKSAFVIAFIGVIIPLGAGFLLAQLYYGSDIGNLIWEYLFIGLILTATSVSITVETLKEMGKLSTRVGNAILGAALIDDILGMVGLTLITSMAGEEVNIFLVLGKILLFFLLSIVAGMLIHQLMARWMDREINQRRYAVISLAFCMMCAFVSDHFFGVADITGAFIAGLIISNTKQSTYIASRCDILSYMLLSPVFFASIGLQVELDALSASTWIFTLLLTLVAIATKIIGCGLGAKACGYSSRESLQVGIGMVSRGEVALIMANKGLAAGILPAVFITPVIVMVTVTVVIAPIMLRLAFRKQTQSKYAELEMGPVTEKYREVADLEIVTQKLLTEHKNIQNRAASETKQEKGE